MGGSSRVAVAVLLFILAGCASPSEPEPTTSAVTKSPQEDQPEKSPFSDDVGWYQRGGDAGRSSSLPGGGPLWDSVAFTLPSPAGKNWGLHNDPGHTSAGTMLIVRGDLITTTDGEIVAISLATGASRHVTSLSPGTYSIDDWATNGDNLYVIEPLDPTLRIIPLNGGLETAVALLEQPQGQCWMALDGELFTACLTGAGPTGVAVEPFLVVQQRKTDGSLVWDWTLETDPRAISNLQERARVPSPVQKWLCGITVSHNEVFVEVCHFAGALPTENQSVRSGYLWDGWILDRSTGAMLGPGYGTGTGSGVGTEGDAPKPVPTPYEPPPVVAARGFVIRQEVDSAISTDTYAPPLYNVTNNGNTIRLLPLSRGSTGDIKPALAGDHIIIPSSDRLIGLDSSGITEWNVPLPQPATYMSAPVMDETAVFMTLGGTQGTPPTLWAFDATSGAVLWSRELSGTALGMAGGNGTLTVMTSDPKGQRTITVFGMTPASIQAQVEATSQYPEPAEEVVVDLSSSRPGLGGPATRFRVDWGDGGSTGWVGMPELAHTYNSIGDFRARVYLANDAGQVSSTFADFYVGRPPPQNFMQQQFADDNQNRTFFILGLLATCVVSAAGLARGGRRRRRLHRELRSLENDYHRLESTPDSCDAMLTERRAKARALFLERKLEEAHASFLATRIEELRRSLRLGTADAKLKFLPHGLVLRLQRLLADARVDEYEREHFVRALEQEHQLTKRQKTEAVQLIDSWFTRDMPIRR